MLLKNQTKPYEVEKGQSDKLVEQWVLTLTGALRAGKGFH